LPFHESSIIAAEEVITIMKGADKEILRKVFVNISHFETLPPWETLRCFMPPVYASVFSIREKLLIDNFMIK